MTLVVGLRFKNSKQINNLFIGKLYKSFQMCLSFQQCLFFILCHSNQTQDFVVLKQQDTWDVNFFLSMLLIIFAFANKHWSEREYFDCTVGGVVWCCIMGIRESACAIWLLRCRLQHIPPTLDVVSLFRNGHKKTETPSKIEVISWYWLSLHCSKVKWSGIKAKFPTTKSTTTNNDKKNRAGGSGCH